MRDNCRSRQINPLVLQVFSTNLMVLEVLPQLLDLGVYLYAAPIFLLVLFRRIWSIYVDLSLF